MGPGLQIAAAATARAEGTRDTRATLFVWLTFAALAGRFALVIWRHTVNMLFWDQWDFYTPLFDSAPLWQVFLRQHGPHREGIGLVMDKFVVDATHWSNRAEAMFMVVCVAGAAALALELKRRLIGRIDYLDVAIPMLFFTMQQWEAFLYAANPSYAVVPMLLLIAYCLCWTIPREGFKFAVLLLLNFLLIYTGFGFFVGPITIALFALELIVRLRTKHPLALPVVSLVVALLSLASFFVHYTWTPAADCFAFPYPDKSAYAKFLALMLAYFPRADMAHLAYATGAVLGAAIVFVLLWHFAGLLRRREWQPLDVVAVTLASFTCLFCLNAAVGRVCLGLAAAQSSRYMGFLVPALLAVYLHLRASEIRLARVGTVVFVLALAPACLLRPRAVLDSAAMKTRWKQCYLATGDIANCNRVSPLPIYPFPAATHLQEKLDFLRRHHLNLYKDAH